MKTIKIIRGVFGYVDAPGKPIIAKTKKDPAFSVDNAIADRLVEKKMAVYADVAHTNLASEYHDYRNTAEYSEDMTRDKLNEIAKRYGVEAPEKIRGGKAAVIDEIEREKAKSETEKDEDDGSGEVEGSREAPPALDVADPV